MMKYILEYDTEILLSICRHMSPEIVAAVARRNLSNPECPVNNSHVFALSKRKVEKKKNFLKKKE